MPPPRLGETTRLPRSLPTHLLLNEVKRSFRPSWNQLQSDRKHVIVVPGLYFLATCQEAYGSPLIAQWLVAFVGRLYCIKAYHFVPFSDEIVNRDVEVGKARVKPGN